MDDFTARTKLLLGTSAMEKLQNSTVAVVGLGGVGGSCAEALVRCGVGHLVLMDHDTVDVTNLNRQILATRDGIGQLKIKAAAKRFLAIDPKMKLTLLDQFYGESNKNSLFAYKPEFVADAIDTVTSKLILITECRAQSIPVISSMGTGNRLDPTRFCIGTILDTAGHGCGLSKVMRRLLRAQGITDLTVLYSTEPPLPAVTDTGHGRHSPGSVSFCPPVAGYIMASYIIKRIIEE